MALPAASRGVLVLLFTEHEGKRLAKSPCLE